jgi:hypothetical protein
MTVLAFNPKMLTRSGVSLLLLMTGLVGLANTGWGASIRYQKATCQSSAVDGLLEVRPLLHVPEGYSGRILMADHDEEDPPCPDDTCDDTHTPLD